MDNCVEIQLPNNTSEPSSGPVFRYAAEKLIVDYDKEITRGTVVWTRLEFTGVVAVKWVEEAWSDVDDIGGFDHLKCWDSSAWRDEIVSRWEKQYPHLDPDACGRLLHYLLYCDHAGTLHVIASDVKIIENPELDALNALPPCR